MFWRSISKIKNEPSSSLQSTGLASTTNDANNYPSISEMSNDESDEVDTLNQEIEREMQGGNDKIKITRPVLMDRNPNEALFHILGRKFELYNDGDPFYINNSDVISWKELQYCFLALVWVSTWQSTSSGTSICKNAKDDQEQPVKPSLTPQQQKKTDLSINVASVKNKFHYPPTQQQRHQHVLMHVPVDIVYSLWEHIISLSCPTFLAAGGSVVKPDMLRSSQQQKWTPSTQLAMEFIRDALVSFGVIQILECFKPSTIDHSSSTSQGQLIRINQDIHYQYGLFSCQSEPIYSNLILPYQNLWHSIVIQAYLSWFFHPLQQRLKLKNYESNETFDLGIICDNSIWDLDEKNNERLLQLDGGYSLLMLPYHLILSNKTVYFRACQKLLCSDCLIQARLKLMGIVCGTVQHVKDCEQLFYHAQQKQVKQHDEIINTNSTVCLRSIVDTIWTAYKKLYVQLHSATTGMENSLIMLADVGRAMLLLATSLGECCADTKESFELQLSIYQEALELFKTSLSSESIEVAEALHCCGFVKETYKSEHPFNLSARECYIESLRIKLLHYGREHPYVSKTVHNLGTLYCEQGDYNIALSMFEETLRVRRQTLGPNDDSVADTLQWIASVYRELEMHRKSLEYFDEALRIKRHTVGEDHIETGNVCHNLGIVYDDLGQCKMSIKFCQEALRIRKLCLEEDDELIAESLHLMANVYLGKGDKMNSLRCYEEALQIRERRLSLLQPLEGGSISDKCNSTIEKLLECYEEALPLKKLEGGAINSAQEVAKMTYRVADLYNKHTHNLDKSIDCFKDFVNLQAKILMGAGDHQQKEHIMLNNALQNLGILYEKNQDYQRSVLYFEEALRKKREMLGDNSEEVAETLFRTGCVYVKLCDYERGILYLKESLRVHEDNNSSEEDGVALCQHQIGIAHDALGQYEDAILWFSSALKLNQEQTTGLDDSSISTFISNPKLISDILRDLGHSYDAKGDVNKALEYYQKSRNLIKSAFGERHEDLGDAHYNIGNAYAKMKQYDLALKSFDAALDITNTHFEPIDLSIGNILHNKGLIHAEFSDFVQAKTMFEQALHVYKINLPGDSIEVANTLHNTAALCDKTANYDDAIKFYSDSLKMKRKVLGNDHLSVAQTLNNLGIVEAKRLNYEVANASLQESLRIKRHCLGEHHESVASTLHNIGKIYDSKQEFDKALLCYNEALRLRKSILGSESIEVSTTLQSMGESYLKTYVAHHNEDYLTEAVKCFSAAVQIRERTLGPNHIDTCNSIRELGMTYVLCHKEKEALKTLEDFVKIFRLNESKCRSLSHAIEAFNALAGLYMSKNEYKNGLRCLQEVNELCEKHCDDSYAIVDSLYRIGTFFMEQSDNESALEYIDRAIAKADAIPIRQNVSVGRIYSTKGAIHAMKKENDDAIHSLENCVRIYNDNSEATDHMIVDVQFRLSELYVTQNDLEKAWDYGYEALQTLKKTNSKIDKIASLNDLLGSISLQRQDFSGAKAYFDDAIKVRVAATGDNDSSLAGSFFQLGVALDAQGEFTPSVLAFKRSLQIRNRNKMRDSLETAELFARLGCAHAKVKEYDDALTCLTNALNIRLDSSGERTLDVADILSNMGGIYDANSKFEKAYELYKDSLSIYENILGSSHVRVSDVLVRIGAYHARRKEYGAAIEIYKRALTIKKTHLGDDDIAVAKILRCMADILSLEEVGKHESAVVLYKEALRISKLADEVSNIERGKLLIKMAESCQQIPGKENAIDYYLEALQLYHLDNEDDSLDFASLLLSVGKQYALKNDSENAVKCLTKSLAVRTIKLSKGDPGIGQVLAELGEVQESSGNYVEAAKSYSDSLSILRLTSNAERSKALVGRLLLRLGELHSKNRNYEDAMASLAESLEILKEVHGEGNIDVGKAFYALGVVLLEQANVDEAISHLKSAFAILKPAFGVESIEVSNTLFHLGSALTTKQDYKSAKICFAECLQMRNLKLKPDNALIAHVSKSLGELHLLLKEYAEAVQHLEVAKKIYRKSLGKKSIVTADISSKMASAYAFQGDNSKAEVCFKEALFIYKDSHNDSDHQQVADLLIQMGKFYADRKMFNEAIDCLKQALQMKKRLFGNDDIGVAALAEHIADVLLLEGGSQNEAAIKCYLEAKRIYDKSHAEHDERTIDGSALPVRSACILSKLGDLYENVGEREQAVDFYIDCLSSYRSAIGEDSVESAAIYHKLGNLYHEVDEYDMAMDSFRRSLVARKKHLGDDHIDVANTLRDKGSVHESRGEVDEAIDCYEESFRVYKLNLIAGSDVSVLHLLNRAGFLAIRYSTQAIRQDAKEELFGLEDGYESYDRETYIQKATKFFNDALLIGKTNKNIDEATSEVLADTYFGLGLVHSESSSLGAAIDCFRSSLKIRQEKFGEFHPQVAAVWFSLGSIYFREGDFKEALKCFDEALKIRKKLITADSTAEEFTEVANILYKIGVTLKSLGEFDKSLRCFKQCLQVREAKLGSEHLGIAKTFNNLGVVASKLGNYPLAVQYWHKSIHTYKASGNMNEQDRVVQAIRGNIEMAERLS